MTEISRNKKLLAYGPPGSWKTTSACLLAPGPVHIVDVDCKARRLQALEGLIGNGKLTVKEFNIPLVEDPLRVRITNPDKPPLRRPEGYLKIVDYLTDVLEKKPEIPPHKTLVVDSLTKIVEHFKRLLMYVNKKAFFEFREWGIMLGNMEELLGALIPMTENLIVIAHDRLERDEESGHVTGVRPLIDTQMRDKIAMYFDDAWHYEPLFGGTTGKMHFRVRTQPSEIYTARSSSEMDVIMDVEGAFKKLWPETVDRKEEGG